MKRYLWLACVLLAVATSGCVERRFLVTSQLPGMPDGQDAGATVYVNGEFAGATPADVYYTYYGTYHLTIVKDGCQTLQVDQPIPAPWYEFPLVDFVAENVYPWKIRDLRTFNYVLQPWESVRPEDVLQRGEALRQRGLAVQPLPDALPPKPKPAPVPAAKPAVPPGS